MDLKHSGLHSGIPQENYSDSNSQKPITKSVTSLHRPAQRFPNLFRDEVNKTPPGVGIEDIGREEFKETHAGAIAGGRDQSGKSWRRVDWKEFVHSYRCASPPVFPWRWRAHFLKVENGVRDEPFVASLLPASAATWPRCCTDSPTARFSH